MAGKKLRLVFGLLSGCLLVAGLAARPVAAGTPMTRVEMTQIFGGTCFCNTTTYGTSSACGSTDSGICSPCGNASCADYCPPVGISSITGKVNSRVHPHYDDCPLGNALTCTNYVAPERPGSCLCGPIGLFPYVSCGSYAYPVGGC